MLKLFVILKKKNMTEKELIELGFQREDVSAEESGHTSYYYYLYYLTDGCIFTSNANDEVENNDWFVYEEDFLCITTNSYKNVKAFINAFQDIINNKQ